VFIADVEVDKGRTRKEGERAGDDAEGGARAEIGPVDVRGDGVAQEGEGEDGEGDLGCSEVH
jgi:hypothetical protein